MMAARTSALTQGIQALAGMPAGDGMPIPGDPARLAALAPAATSKGAARTKLWTLDRKFHCLTIGTCIPVDELAKVARRFAFAAKPCDDFGIHVEAVGYCGARNAVSEALQRLLDRLYAAALRDFAALRNAEQLRERWDRCFDRGQVAGPLWAALSHKHADQALRQALYAQVHMLSHQIGAGLAADVRRLEFLERDASDARRELAETRRTLAQRAEIGSAELASLRAENAALRGDRDALQAAQARLNQIESGVAMTGMARRLLQLSDENAALRTVAARCDGLAERAYRLQRELAASRRETTALRAEREALNGILTAALKPQKPAASAAGGTVPDRDDCLRCAEQNGLSRSRCILCVGGRTSLLSHYRALAERLGIRLLHHDGGQEEALSRLPEMIASADAVLCPTDCVGHAAYYSLKQQCRKTGKRCLLFKGAGVTSFAFALSRLAAGESSLGAGTGETTETEASGLAS
ncbi:MAG TPA: DUF2325 domain-containing protein [Rhodocyclaceae bacterium]